MDEALRELVYALTRAVGEDSGPGRSVEAYRAARQAEKDLLEAIDIALVAAALATVYG